MKFLRHVLVLLLFCGAVSAQGDIRSRLQRRFPDPRGILEEYYTGDAWDFYTRIRFASGAFAFTFITDKARGEDWGDLTAGGASWSPPGGPVRSVSAGWLRADLGSGLVLAVPGSFSSLSELAMYKPPGIRNRIEPATSPWGCRGTPLVGAGAVISMKTLDISVLGALSPIDSLAGGYHRTPSEVAGRNAFTEKLAGVRLSRGFIGLTAAAAEVSDPDEYSWFRAGADWSAEIGTITSSGEIALGQDSAGSGLAGWTAISGTSGNFRHMVMLLRNPSGFPSRRSGAPVSRECDAGICLGVRWRFLPGAALKTGAGAYFQEDNDLLLASGQVEYRFPFSMEASIGVRTRTETDRFAWRGWLGSVWLPHDLISVSTKVQVSGWSDSQQDSTESGTGMEMKLRFCPRSGVQLDIGGAACSTDGYNSRVYAGGSSFPGVFGSTAMYNRTLILYTQLSVSLDEDITIRGALSRRTTDGASSLGSGWEETQGDSRTEFGFQLDYAFH